MLATPQRGGLLGAIIRFYTSPRMLFIYSTGKIYHLVAVWSGDILRVASGRQWGIETICCKWHLPHSSHLAAFLQEALRASPGATRLWTQASKEIQSPITLGHDKIEAAVSGAEKYLQVSMSMLE